MKDKFRIKLFSEELRKMGGKKTEKKRRKVPTEQTFQKRELSQD